MSARPIPRKAMAAVQKVRMTATRPLRRLGDAANREASRIELERMHQRAARAERRLAVARAESDLLRTAVVDLTSRLTDDPTTDNAAHRTGDPAPSFRYKLAEQRRISLQMAESRGVVEPVMDIDDKFAGARFAVGAGLAVPEIYVPPTQLGEIDFESLPDEFVLKPTGGHSSRGVYPLVRTADGLYRSLLDRSATFTEAEIRVRFQTDSAGGHFTDDLVMVEELMAEPGPDGLGLPVEWRFFCFGGVVRLVMGRSGDGYRSLRRARFRYFDREWTDLGIVRLENKHDPTIEIPRRARESIAVAENLAARVPRAMVRIDLHVLERGVFFGEVTPEPGGVWALVSELDRRFGEYWEAAEADLWADAIERGVQDLQLTEIDSFEAQ